MQLTTPPTPKRKQGVIAEKMFMLLRCLCCCVHLCTLVYVEKGFAIERCAKSDALKNIFHGEPIPQPPRIKLTAVTIAPGVSGIAVLFLSRWRESGLKYSEIMPSYMDYHRSPIRCLKPN